MVKDNIIHPGYTEHPAPDREDNPPLPSGYTVETEEDVVVPISADSAEEALLGIFMQDEDAARYIAQSGLREDHFLKKKNQHLYALILNVRFNKGTCNFDFVVDECEKKVLSNGQNLLDFIGGASSLTEIIATPIATDLKTTEGYIKIVWERSRLARVKEKSRILTGLSSFDNTKITDTISDLQGIITDTTLDKHGLVSIGHLLPDAYKRFEDRLAHPEKYIGIKTGFKWLDEYDAVGRKRTTIVAAKTNVGKSIFSGQMITSMIADGLNVLLFTPEQAKEQYIDRMICSSQNIPIDSWKKASDIRTFELDKARLFIDKIVSTSPDSLYIEDRGSQTANYILSSIRRHMLTHTVDVVVVDYIQKLRYYTDNIRRDVDNALDKLSSFAKDNNIVLIVVSQLKRTKEAEPELNDLKESGNLENFADSVVLLHRKDLMKVPERTQGYYSIAKNRAGQCANYIQLQYDPFCLKFTEKDAPPEDNAEFEALDADEGEDARSKVIDNMIEQAKKEVENGET